MGRLSSFLYRDGGFFFLKDKADQRCMRLGNFGAMTLQPKKKVSQRTNMEVDGASVGRCLRLCTSILEELKRNVFESPSRSIGSEFPTKSTVIKFPVVSFLHTVIDVE